MKLWTPLKPCKALKAEIPFLNPQYLSLPALHPNIGPKPEALCLATNPEALKPVLEPWSR